MRVSIASCYFAITLTLMLPSVQYARFIDNKLTMPPWLLNEFVDNRIERRQYDNVAVESVQTPIVITYDPHQEEDLLSFIKSNYVAEPNSNHWRNAPHYSRNPSDNDNSDVPFDSAGILTVHYDPQKSFERIRSGAPAGANNELLLPLEPFAPRIPVYSPDSEAQQSSYLLPSYSQHEPVVVEAPEIPTSTPEPIYITYGPDLPPPGPAQAPPLPLPPPQHYVTSAALFYETTTAISVPFYPFQQQQYHQGISTVTEPCYSEKHHNNKDFKEKKKKKSIKEKKKKSSEKKKKNIEEMKKKFDLLAKFGKKSKTSLVLGALGFAVGGKLNSLFSLRVRTNTQQFPIKAFNNFFGTKTTTTSTTTSTSTTTTTPATTTVATTTTTEIPTTVPTTSSTSTTTTTTTEPTTTTSTTSTTTAAPTTTSRTTTTTSTKKPSTTAKKRATTTKTRATTTAPASTGTCSTTTTATRGTYSTLRTPGTQVEQCLSITVESDYVIQVICTSVYTDANTYTYLYDRNGTSLVSGSPSVGVIYTCNDNTLIIKSLASSSNSDQLSCTWTTVLAFKYIFYDFQ